MRQRATRLTSVAAAGRAPFRLSDLFRGGQQGLWWMPESHRAALAGAAGATPTLFQDSVGTSPVSVIEQVTGRIIDLSGRGNHATQSTAPARPALTARKNLLTWSEQFDGASWGFASGATVSANTHVAPDGTLTADTATDPGNQYSLINGTDIPASPTTDYTLSFHVRKTSGATTHPGFSLIFLGGATKFVSCSLNTNTGAAVLRPGEALGSVSVTDAGAYWRLAITSSSTATTTSVRPRIYLVVNTDGGATWTPDPAGSVVLWGAQLEIGAAVTSYQRVTTATDYDWQAGNLALNFDGLDDGISAPFAAGTMPTSADVYLVASRSPGEAHTIGVYSGLQNYLFAASATSYPSAGVSSGAGGFALQVNGASVIDTRSSLDSAWKADGATRIVSALGVNLSAWTSAEVGGYAGGWQIQGGVRGVLICPAQTAATRTKIRKALAKQFGIQGVV